ncbi:MAG TPA: hypothetical protein VJ805_04705 [Nitrospiraceae bacterium]|nr:hypothetical protein [Nitrospiraceae bacterium]
MAIRPCPRCVQGTLVSNGAFWVCGRCRYAATSMALAMDQGATDPSWRNPGKTTSTFYSPRDFR